MTMQSNRRSFVKQSAAAAAASAAAGFFIVKSGVLAAGNSPNGKLNIAVIGCGKRAPSNLKPVASENIVALCDCNEVNLGKMAKTYPKAKTYIDWRECLEQKDIDAVIVQTCDHTHAFVANWALLRGKHVYCEKPLGNSVQEARVVRETYLKMKDKVATQMGVQRHAIPNMARVRELIRDGAIGVPQSVNLWCGRLPKAADYLPEMPVPATMRWDLWIGPSPMHPYNTGYLKGGCLNWNQYWDFGSGQIGDMGSHIMDIAWWALDLGLPTTCECQGSEFHPSSVPTWITAKWDHPANDWRPAVKVGWYDGGKLPGMPSPVFNPDGMKAEGAIFKGDAGFLVCGFNSRYLMPTKGDMTQYNRRKPEDIIPPVKSHHQEWLDACKGDLKTRTDFEYSGNMIEHNLLSLVAYRVGKALEYDPKTGAVTNCPEAEQYIKKTYRPGWTLAG